MRSLLSSIILLSAFGLAELAVCAQAPPQSMPMGGMGSEPTSRITAQVPGPLLISFGSRTAEWTQAALAALPHTTVTVYNEHARANQSYSGVPLMDLLARVGVPTDPHGKQLRLYLEAVGSDGYIAVYSMAEVNPALHNATVIVADSLEGKPIAAEGPFKLISTADRRPARWVRNLAAIRVLTAE